MRELLFAHPEPLRFGELIDSLPGISRNLLAGRLRDLEEAGVVERHTSGAARAMGGWSLTTGGASLGPVVRAAADWSMGHIEDPTGADPRGVRRRIASLG